MTNQAECRLQNKVRSENERTLLFNTIQPHMMRKSLFSLMALLFILVSACSKGGNSVTVKGSFRHLQDGQFYVFSTDPAWGSFDTIRISDGAFSFTHELYDTVLLTVQYPNFLQMPIIAIPGKTITIKGDANNLLSTRISGSEENEALSDFRRSIMKKTPSEVKRLAEDFIIHNPASYASMAVLEKYFLSEEKADYARISKLLRLMSGKAPGRASLQMLQRRLSGQLNCRTGNKLPAFSAVTVDGKKVNNATIKNHYALITLWATWSSEMSDPMRAQRSVLRQYLDSIRIINISLDSDTTETLRRVRADSIPGYMICDRMSWQSPLARTFGVRYLPTNILVDRSGRIIGRDLNDTDLPLELEKAFKH